MLVTVVGVELLLIASAPLSVSIAAVLSVAARSTRPVRSVALLVGYSVVELSALLQISRGVRDWDELARDVVARGYRVFRRVLDVSVVVEEGSATDDELRSPHGVIVLARHCGPGDSLFIAWLLMVRHRLRVRIVLKQALRWEPTVDIAGDHLPLCFVRRRRRSADDVGALAAGLREGEALLLFPEGGNFSWPRWREAISRLRSAGNHREARRALRRTHTLPPRPGGASAALAAAPDADVLLLAHSGFGPDGRDRPLWRLPVHHELVIRTVLLPARDVPRDEDGVRRFLDEAWSQVDTWVEGHAALLALRKTTA
jgi:1-acyl-sn-glycerol-3-phosphate acyltransferase